MDDEYPFPLPGPMPRYTIRQNVGGYCMIISILAVLFGGLLLVREAHNHWPVTLLWIAGGVGFAVFVAVSIWSIPAFLNKDPGEH